MRSPLKEKWLILKSRWKTLLQQFNAEQSISETVFLDLVAAYSSPERHYHNLKHIQQILDTIERLKNQAINLPAIEFAAWFHDVIYDSKAKDNEHKSAEYAEIVLNKLTIPRQTIHRVRKLILDTKNHQIDEDDIDSQILLDADMSILGTNNSEYINYAKAIRQEYSWISQQNYCFGRREFLESILDREKIYYTPEFFDTLEIQARINIQMEITELLSQ